MTSQNTRKGVGVSTTVQHDELMYHSWIITQNFRVGRRVNITTSAGTTAVYDVTSSIRHFENVCIVPHTDMHPMYYPFQARFTVYAPRRAKNATNAGVMNKLYLGYTKPRNNYWMFDYSPEPIPGNWTVHNEIAILPAYWVDSTHVFLFWYETMVRIYGQIHHVKNQRSAWYNKNQQVKNMKMVFISPRIKNMPQEYRKALLAHGFSQLFNYTDLIATSQPTCFRHVIAGEKQVSQAKAIRDIRQQVDKTFGLTKHACDAYKVTLLRRLTSRHILNIYALAEMIDHNGFDVQVVSFEGKTIQQQLEVLRCTSALIAVQGAALAWMIFLPHRALLVELYWSGWGPRYAARAARLRPDLSAKTVRCQSVASDDVLSTYAQRWFNHTGRITPAIKKKLYAKSRAVKPAFGHVFKDSDCVCSNKTIANALKMSDKFRRHFGYSSTN